MISAYFYKTVRRVPIYVFLAVFILLTLGLGEIAKTAPGLLPIQKLLCWSSSEMAVIVDLLIAVETLWLILGDIVNGTYRNVIAGGIYRRSYYFTQTVYTVIVVTVELVIAWLAFFERISETVGFSLISPDQWRMYFIYLVMVWVRHVSVVVFISSLCFAARKMYVVMPSLLGLALLMIVENSLLGGPSWMAKVMKYMPYALSGTLDKEIAAGVLVADTVIWTLIATIVPALIAAVIALVVFERADLQ